MQNVRVESRGGYKGVTGYVQLPTRNTRKMNIKEERKMIDKLGSGVYGQTRGGGFPQTSIKTQQATHASYTCAEVGSVVRDECIKETREEEEEEEEERTTCASQTRTRHMHA